MSITLEKVSALPAAQPLSNADIVYLVQSISGVLTSVQTTVGAIVADAVAAAEAAIVIPDPTIVDFVNDASTARDFTSADAGKVIRHSAATAVTATIQTNATHAIPTKSVLTGRQSGAGVVTIVAVSGVTLNIPNAYQAVTRDVGSVYMLHKVGTNEFDLTGDLLAV